MTAPNNISESPLPDSPSSDKNGEIPDVEKSVLAKSAKTKSTPRKKIGRPKGQPKTGGRKKPGPEPSGREARKYLEQNSGYLDLLCRMLRGKPIKRQGPTGKLVWYHPDFDDQKWALAQVLPRMIPSEPEAWGHIQTDGTKALRKGDVVSVISPDGLALADSAMVVKSEGGRCWFSKPLRMVSFELSNLYSDGTHEVVAHGTGYAIKTLRDGNTHYDRIFPTAKAAEHEIERRKPVKAA